MDSNFAQNEMKRRGWKSGQGLGRNSRGIRDYIKVKRKSDTGGLGHSLGDEFTFHWWDHVFNKTANSIRVNENEGEDGGVTITTEKPVGPVSFRKPLRRNYQGQELVYGMFIRAGTYQPTLTSKQPSASDDEDEEDPFAFSSDSSDDEDGAMLNSGLDTFDKVYQTTGMTGHKGARHGQTMSGKLARILEQESNNTSQQSPHNSPPHQTCSAAEASQQDDTAKCEKKKKTKKKTKTTLASTEQSKDDNLAIVAETADIRTTRKKKKRKNAAEPSTEPVVPEPSPENSTETSTTTPLVLSNSTTDDVHFLHDGLDTRKTKKKKKKKKTNMDVGIPAVEHFSAAAENSALDNAAAADTSTEEVKKKKKTTKRKLEQAVQVVEQVECVPEKKRKKKKSKTVAVCDGVQAICDGVTEHATKQEEHVDEATGQSQAKKKRAKKRQTCDTTEQPVNAAGHQCEVEAVSSPVQKKKKKKNREQQLTAAK